MENLNLAELGVQEMSFEDKRNVNGGWWGVIAALALYVVAEWDDISDGWNDAAEGKDFSYERK